MKKINIFCTCLIIFISLCGSAQTNPLLIPPVMTGPVYNLNMQKDTTYWFDHPFATMGYNGNILGPTLIWNKGEDITLNVTNNLGATTTTHWHGAHVAPENDGGPYTAIFPGETWSPNFTVLDKATTLWYHPHLHHFTMKQVVLGLSGLIIVRDSEEAALALPRTYAVDDFPLIMQTKAINCCIFDVSQIQYSTTEEGNGMNPNNDAILFVNATLSAALNVPRQVVRFRLLNGSSHRVFNYGISDGSTFWQIGSDGGLLNNSVPLTRLMLAPGERAEILVDLTSYSVGNSFTFKSFASELPDGYWGATNAYNTGTNPGGYAPNPKNGVDFDLLTVNVVAQTASPITSIPSSLVTVTPIDSLTADITRNKYFITGGAGSVCPQISSTPTGIPDECFDMDVINHVTNLDHTELWILHGDDNQYHPFHIHDVQFNILERDGVPPPLNERGLKDMVVVGPNEVVKIIMKFEDFVGDVPYMYHCHILPHEDRGMMGQFIVNPNIYIDKNFTGIEKGTLANPFNTIREGVNIGHHGVKLNILSTGVHNEAPPSLLMIKGVEFVLHNPPVIIE